MKITKDGVTFECSSLEESQLVVSALFGKTAEGKEDSGNTASASKKGRRGGWTEEEFNVLIELALARTPFSLVKRHRALAAHSHGALYLRYRALCIGDTETMGKRFTEFARREGRLVKVVEVNSVPQT